MLWIKAFHVIFMVMWFAGLFYLPRLFVYHAVSEDRISIERFKVMEWRLYWCITTPGAILTTLCGISLMIMGYSYYAHALWLHIKLALALGLWGYHIYLAVLLKHFAADKNRHSQRFYRVLNEVPTLFLISMVILAVVK
ncbi:MAG: CopD family protein [Gammaproteobacteria bacterium]|nr:CopD family protein [Gammaproteobacteria bacterium]